MLQGTLFFIFIFKTNIRLSNSLRFYAIFKLFFLPTEKRFCIDEGILNKKLLDILHVRFVNSHFYYLPLKGYSSGQSQSHFMAEKNKLTSRFVQRCLEMCKNKQKTHVYEDFQ